MNPSHGAAWRSDRRRHRLTEAGLAQLVEHVICNHGVGGSNPSAGTSVRKIRFFTA